MSNGEVLAQIQRILDSDNATLPANVTAQLLFAALIELSRRFDTSQAETAAWRVAMEKRLDRMEGLNMFHTQIEEEREKSRINIRDVMSRLVEPVIVAIITTILIGAIIAYTHPGAP